MVVVTLGLAAAGVLALRELPIDAYPDVSSTQVKVIIKAPGMTPEEVEARITTPIELELLGHSVQARGALDVEVRDRRHHARFRGRHRHLLGAPAGRRAAGEHRARPAAGHLRGTGADHHAARRDVHVHHRGRPALARREAHAARLDHSAGAAHAPRSRRRQRARRLGTHLLGGARPRGARRARRDAGGARAGARGEQPQRRCGARARRRGNAVGARRRGSRERSTT